MVSDLENDRVFLTKRARRCLGQSGTCRACPLSWTKRHLPGLSAVLDKAAPAGPVRWRAVLLKGSARLVNPVSPAIWCRASGRLGSADVWVCGRGAEPPGSSARSAKPGPTVRTTSSRFSARRKKDCRAPFSSPSRGNLTETRRLPGRAAQARHAPERAKAGRGREGPLRHASAPGIFAGHFRRARAAARITVLTLHRGDGGRLKSEYSIIKGTRPALLEPGKRPLPGKVGQLYRSTSRHITARRSTSEAAHRKQRTGKGSRGAIWSTSAV